VWLVGEELANRGSTPPSKCAPPAKERCVGYSLSIGGTKCGTAYEQSTGCEKCAKGYYTSFGACLACPSVDVFYAVILPTLLNILVIVSILPTLLCLKIAFEWTTERIVVAPEKRRSLKTIVIDAVRQTIAFVIHTTTTIQFIASINEGASGTRSKWVNGYALFFFS
jgi:hypothetical protein